MEYGEIRRTLNEAARKIDAGDLAAADRLITRMVGKGLTRNDLDSNLGDDRIRKLRDWVNAGRPGTGPSSKPKPRSRSKKPAGKAPKVADRCARKGPISSKMRDDLPEAAFALGKERKFPLYKLSGGKLTPSASHASNAKAVAKRGLTQGTLTKSQYARVVREANKVLAKCSPTAKKQRAKVRRKATEAERRRALNKAINDLL
jgi:nucleoid-associated protein YgaU